MALFGGRNGGSGTTSPAPRIPRHSSAWPQLQKYLQAQDSLRILDIGPTSASNINYLTALGHSIYMADLVEDAARPDYRTLEVDGPNAGKTIFEVQRFLDENLTFPGRNFDVVFLWDAIDYLPDALIQPVLDRLYEVMEPSGKLLAVFHSKVDPQDSVFSRYHLTATDNLEIQRIGTYPILHAFTTRQIETAFSRFAANKFFLAKDSLREVSIVR